MIDMRQRKLTFAFLALLLLFAACKSESPTAPPLGTGPGTGVTPPSGASITLTASSPTAVVNGNVTITATVTENNQNVPNGTAVQFNATAPGTFTEGANAPNSVVRTTTNGVATATLTSAAAGTITVTATVNNVSKSVQVTFSTAPVTPQPPSTTPTITNVTPTSGLPTGGQQVTISGTNFITPVRVLFDTGDGNPKEAFVVSVTPNQIIVLTPSINLGTGQTQAADIIVITQAGTQTEQRVVKSAAFTFAAAVLTPDIRALQPTSGPVDGGTRVTIIGDAFQAPVQVFFGSAEAQVISINFSQIVVMSPRASDTTPNGSGVVTGPVDVKVVNINSNKSATMTGGFRYIPKMQITTVGPTEGPFTGGTRVLIDGSGFTPPVGVVIGGIAAQVISVSGTEIVAITAPVTVTSCGDITGPITVTNTNNGDQASGPSFIFRVPKPLIVNVSNPNNLGGTATITVLNALGFSTLQVGGVTVPITASVVNPNGTTTFTVQLPTTIQLNTLACPAGGSAPQPTSFDVVYTSSTTTCTATLSKGITINPAAAPVLFLNPNVFQSFTATITKATIGPPPTPASVAPSSPQTIQIVNNGTTALTVNSVSTAGAGCANFVFGPAVPPTVTLNECESLPVSVTYLGQTTPGTQTCTLTITTTAGTKNLLLVGTSQ